MRGWVCQAMLLLALVVPVLTVPALTVPALAQAPAGNPGATPTERWLLNRLRAPLGRPDFATLSPELAAFFDDPRRERLAGWQVAFFALQALVGFMLGGFVGAGLGGLTQAN